MALVNYSDSESDTEPERPNPAAAAPKVAFKASEPGKIKIELPALKAEPGQRNDEPPAKKARTAGAFGGFNSLLPPPKKTTVNAPRRGINLKTSSEAAFSRATPPAPTKDDGQQPFDDYEDEISTLSSAEVKLVGKNTMFIPPSVANRQKKNQQAPATTATQNSNVSKTAITTGAISTATKEQERSKPRTKQSLFSYQPELDETPASNSLSGGYEPLTTSSTFDLPHKGEAPPIGPGQQCIDQHSSAYDPSSLSAVAADLNLTPAQRRQLFGRHGQDSANIAVATFNLDSEYASNEALRQAGEVVQHRAVKTIAPGKHSLQQLVNNARTQKDAIEDAWAEGRRNRGESANKYGWGTG